jgi:hypothetical protein
MEHKKPLIKNLQEFQGTILTADQFSNSDLFLDKHVLIQGAGPSGKAIAKEVKTKAKKVTISSKKNVNENEEEPQRKILKTNQIIESKNVGVIERARKDGFVTQEGEEIVDVDVFISCIGYKLNYKFLSSDCNIRLDDQESKIMNLYMDMVHREFNSLIFIRSRPYWNAYTAISVQVSPNAQFLLLTWSPVTLQLSFFSATGYLNTSRVRYLLQISMKMQ